MARLFSTPTQFMAIRGMCSREAKISGMFLSSLDASHFHGEESLEAFDAVQRYLTKHGRPPAYNLLSEDIKISQETRDVLKEHTKIPKTQDDCEQVIDRLNQYRKTRILYKMAKDTIRSLEEKTVDLEAILSTAETSFAEARISKDIANQFFHTGKDGTADDLVKEIIYGEDNDQWIPTGWKTFDSVNGGIPRGGLLTLGGASGSGKSHLIVQLAKTQAHMGYKIVVVPLEMTEKESYARLLANIGKVDSLRINLKKLAEEEKTLLWKRYRRFQRQIEENGGRFSIYRPKEDVTIEETLAAVHSFNPDVIYIDYIGLLKGADSEDQWRKLGQIARYGKVYAGNHNKVVALAAQVNDDGKIRYSGAIREHSSLAFTFVATKESRERGYLNMEMLKGRNQQLMNFTLSCDYATSTLKDLDPAQAEEIANTDPTGAPKKKSKNEDSAEDYLPNLDD